MADLFETELARRLTADDYEFAEPIAIGAMSTARRLAKRRRYTRAALAAMLVALIGVVLSMGFQVTRDALSPPGVGSFLDAVFWFPLTVVAVLLGVVVLEVLSALARV